MNLFFVGMYCKEGFMPRRTKKSNGTKSAKTKKRDADVSLDDLEALLSGMTPISPEKTKRRVEGPIDYGFHLDDELDFNTVFDEPQTIEARTDAFMQGLKTEKNNRSLITDVTHVPTSVSKLSTHHFVSKYESKFDFFDANLTRDFYAALDYDPEFSMFDFLAAVKRAPKVRIVAHCHGSIEGVVNPSCSVSRTTSAPNGVCSFLMEYSKKGNNYADFLVKKMTGSEFRTYHTKIMRYRLGVMCVDYKNGHYSPTTRTAFKPVVLKCTTKKEASKIISTKQFGPNERMFNKSYYASPGLRFLFIGYSPRNDDTYVYRNLFAIHESVTLQRIMKMYLTSSTQLTLIDYSCNNPSSEFVMEGETSDEKFAFDDDGVPNANFHRFGGRRL